MGVLHQGMGEAHFGSINSTIAGGFDDGKERREVRIQYDTVDEVLVFTCGKVEERECEYGDVETICLCSRRCGKVVSDRRPQF
jgi:hypothetical protein